MTYEGTESALVVQDNAQQGAADLQVAIVVDEAELPELVHEDVHTRAGRTDDLRQRFLTDLRRDRLWPARLAEIGQNEECSSQALFAGVEQLVDKILLDAAVAGQQMSGEELGKGRLGMQDS